MDLQAFIQKAPKAELHSHIDGGLRVQTVLELAQKHQVELPSYQYDELLKTLTIDNSCTSLLDYFKPFEYTLNVLQTEDALERAMYEYLEDSSKDHIKYIEARFSPALHLQKHLSLKKVMEAILSGKKQAEKDFDIKSNLIICGLRQNKVQKNMELAQLAVDYKNKGVVAFDLAGEEYGHPAKNHMKAFEIAIKNNLCRTVHAGEADGAHSIADSIHYLGAQRIGHGTHLFEDTGLLNYVVDRQIGLEVCLTSNMQTKSVKDITKHPIQDYFKKKVAVTINTDSTLISGTTLSKEYELAAKLFHFTQEDVSKIMFNGFQQAFLPFDEKQDLLQKMKQEISILS
ncbi:MULTISPECIES: adenosine deaminase [unclassified Lentimicrobium]|uniref:adenosine deaminase n=1 Tax=unclassified Lentimicrobium TaxID=2677434 RepID=UPI0015518EB8|nr:MULTISPECIES: adenosine deaminase [unclassified Lentimicrobium]NPD46836.1 adenosine deaminase [Lentimicrobium sp. S6]NPD85124.1 adenosine deaminase [Lentimicrobium sp. L6]